MLLLYSTLDYRIVSKQKLIFLNRKLDYFIKNSFNVSFLWYLIPNIKVCKSDKNIFYNKIAILFLFIDFVNSKFIKEGGVGKVYFSPY